MLPKVSIITIVYNGIATLEKTIQSIQCQDYPNIEYILVDGGSTDGTVELIKRYQSTVYAWVSEPDKGLYDAMNKGMRLASGDYYWFINSGDEIMAPDTLSKVFKEVADASVYYGDTLMIDSEGNTIGDRRLKPPVELRWKDFIKGMLVSHQSIIVSRKVAAVYNTKYRFSADYEWCLIALMRAKKIHNSQLVLSRFLDGGITKQNILPGLIERFSIMRRYFGFFPTLWAHIPIAWRFFAFLFKHKRF